MWDIASEFLYLYICLEEKLHLRNRAISQRMLPYVGQPITFNLLREETIAAITTVGLQTASRLSIEEVWMGIIECTFKVITPLKPEIRPEMDVREVLSRLD